MVISFSCKTSSFNFCFFFQLFELLKFAVAVPTLRRQMTLNRDRVGLERTALSWETLAFPHAATAAQTKHNSNNSTKGSSKGSPIVSYIVYPKLRRKKSGLLLQQLYTLVSPIFEEIDGISTLRCFFSRLLSTFQPGFSDGFLNTFWKYQNLELKLRKKTPVIFFAMLCCLKINF